MDDELNEEVTTETNDEPVEYEDSGSGSGIGAGIVGGLITLAGVGLVKIGRKAWKKHKEKKYTSVPQREADDEYYDEEE